jgi:hypothetical protein
MASGKACHHVAAAKTRRKYNPAKIADDPGLQVHLWANHADAARYGESIHRSFFSAQTENHYPGQGQLAIAKFTFRSSSSSIPSLLGPAIDSGPNVRYPTYSNGHAFKIRAGALAFPYDQRLFR